MKIDVIESSAKKLVFELEGVDHTFCNALKEQLREDETVSISAYNISHPLVGKPRFFLETKGASPKEALDKAVSELKKKNNAFAKAFDNLKN
ncbi:MAG: DNA-directed RNA polymerase subunit L [Candidatus Nanoarchaeia archaeon]